MLYHLLFEFIYPRAPQLSVLNVTRYITFRTAAASLSALAISLLLGPWMIRKLREFQIGQVIRQEGPTSHRPKAGTPTMGGLLILTAALVPTLLWANLTNIYVWIAVLTTAGFGAIGFADDYLKIVRRSHHGLKPRYKMLFQILIGTGVGLALLVLAHKGSSTARCSCSPFFKQLIPDPGWWYWVCRLRAGLRVECRQLRPTAWMVWRSACSSLPRRPIRRSPMCRQPRPRRLSAAVHFLAGGRADRVLRIARRRVARLPLA